MFKRIPFLIMLLLLAGWLAACQQAGQLSTLNPPTLTPDAPVVPTVEPSPTAVPPRTLTVCLSEEPQTLYLYGGSSRSMWNVLEAIYDGPYDTRGFSAQPVILEKMPSLTDGDARLRPVNVTGGDVVVDTAGQVVALAKGVTVFPSGCRSGDCAVVWDGSSPLQMDQLEVTFRLKDGIRWSDGAPLTAEDSVFSFQVAADPASPTSKGVIDRTASYTAIDPLTVQWVGVPGFVEQRYPTFFFLPLPKHAWGGLTAAQLLTDETVRRQPLGWGPYVIDSWVPGERIHLRKNPLYFRAGEGLPKFDYLDFTFNGNPADSALMALVGGKCDVVDQNAGFLPLLEELINTQNNGRLKLYLQQGPEWEHLDFGIRPASYDDGYNPAAGDRADLFGDVRTRQAFARCIDRNRLIQEVFKNRSAVPAGYLSPTHPLYQTDLPAYTYDPAAGARLLDEVGWKDLDGDPSTPRVAVGVPNVPDGTLLSVRLFTTQAELRRQAALLVQAGLKECGVETSISLLDPGELFAPGPDGPLFGRNFDLALFTWDGAARVPCQLYTSDQIPASGNRWIGANITGFTDERFDAACQAAYWALPDQSDYAAQFQAAERLFAEQLPSIPLYYGLRIAISRPDLCGVELDPTARSLLSGIETVDVGEGCQK
ncbi:MAG TPA: hypothetical protein DEQ80_08705 [Anaerolinea thermolimosa]|uniref:Solute-binding protein family 5 domain-containing protein n=1 Tax=Anaerolinea thermolimosa TaxID=229919 RepID=A0A3D1JHK1_9CHLR|nr:hypothetical protein [Anaerolinea thermolimosa]